MGDEQGEPTTDEQGPDFGQIVHETSEAGAELGKYVGSAVGQLVGEEFGLGEMASDFLGETLGEPVGGIAGAGFGVAAYAGLEIEHLGHAAYDWASEKGGTDPYGGTSAPGGVPDDTTPDGGVDDGGGQPDGGAG